MSHEAFRLLAFRLLKEDGYTLPVDYEIKEHDIYEIAEAYRSRLKCLKCNPQLCDGYVYRLELKNDRIVGQWKFCPIKYSYLLRTGKEVDNATASESETDSDRDTQLFSDTED